MWRVKSENVRDVLIEKILGKLSVMVNCEDWKYGERERERLRKVGL